MVLSGALQPGDKVTVDVVDDELEFDVESGGSQISEGEAEAAAAHEEEAAREEQPAAT